MTKAKGESTSRPARALVAAIALFALFVFAPATASAAPPPLLSQFCESGSGAGQCGFPNGIATNPSTGSIYVADNNRINEFSVWGVFVRAWGWESSTAKANCRPAPRRPAAGRACKAQVSASSTPPKGLLLTAQATPTSSTS